MLRLQAHLRRFVKRSFRTRKMSRNAHVYIYVYNKIYDLS